MIEYEKEFRERAAAELERLPTDSATEDILEDYAVMREQAKACQR